MLTFESLINQGHFWLLLLLQLATPAASGAPFSRHVYLFLGVSARCSQVRVCLVCETHLCCRAHCFILSILLVNSKLSYAVHVIQIAFVWDVTSSPAFDHLVLVF